jgi:putative addiction module component (TIGR02574 family)
MIVANDLLEQALGLPEDERARIGIALIDSVGSGGSPEEVEKAWHEEIRRRLDEADAGARFQGASAWKGWSFTISAKPRCASSIRFQLASFFMFAIQRQTLG